MPRRHGEEPSSGTSLSVSRHALLPAALQLAEECIVSRIAHRVSIGFDVASGQRTVAQGLARGNGNLRARVEVAKTLHERYQALNGHRTGWFYTNRIRMHGQMRDFEACEQLYEEARSRKVDVDSWFYRAMIIACGQVRRLVLDMGEHDSFRACGVDGV